MCCGDHWVGGMMLFDAGVRFVRGGMMRVATVVVWCAFMCVAVMSCSTRSPMGTTLAYSVSGCAEESDVTRATDLGEVWIVSRGGSIHVEQRLNYVCCADIVVTLEQDENTVRIVEKNAGEICRL